MQFYEEPRITLTSHFVDNPDMSLRLKRCLKVVNVSEGWIHVLPGGGMDLSECDRVHLPVGHRITRPAGLVVSGVHVFFV